MTHDAYSIMKFLPVPTPRGQDGGERLKKKKGDVWLLMRETSKPGPLNSQTGDVVCSLFSDLMCRHRSGYWFLNPSTEAPGLAALLVN